MGYIHYVPGKDTKMGFVEYALALKNDQNLGRFMYDSKMICYQIGKGTALYDIDEIWFNTIHHTGLRFEPS